MNSNEATGSVGQCLPGHVELRPQRNSELVLDVLAALLNAADARMLRGTPTMMRLATGLRRPRNRRLGMVVVCAAVGRGDGADGTCSSVAVTAR